MVNMKLDYLLQERSLERIYCTTAQYTLDGQK